MDAKTFIVLIAVFLAAALSVYSWNALAPAVTSAAPTPDACSISQECNATPSLKCNLDSDCVAASCCHATACVLKSQAPNCAGIACSFVGVPETLDYDLRCVCANQTCGVEFIRQTPTPVPTETPISPLTADKITNFSISTDKPQYYGSEELRVSVLITATAPATNAWVTLYGLPSIRGYIYLNQEQEANLTQGENAVNFTFQLPACTSCSGMSYGNHSFNASIYWNGTKLNETNTSIELVPKPTPAS